MSKPNFNTDPREWNEADGKGVVFLDENGEELVTFTSHKEINRETGELEPAHPPAQPGAAKGQIVDGLSKDRPGGGNVVEETDIPLMGFDFEVESKGKK